MTSENKDKQPEINDIKKSLEGKVKKSVVVPEMLSPKSRFRFRCYPGIACFTKCCSGTKIFLSPYDIFRLRKRLGLSYDDFLNQYTVTSTIEQSMLPISVLRMRDDDMKSCRFVGPDGCSVYSDRPLTCRYYPIGMGIIKKFDKNSGEEFFIMVKEDHCLGHNEDKTWTVDEWRADQESDLYDEVNSDWMEIVLKAKTLGMVEFSPKSLDLFFMVSSNLDRFRRFVFESNFLKAYEINPDRTEILRNDELELLKFSLKWLRFVLFGEGDFRINEKAKAEAKERLKESARQQSGEQQRPAD